MFKKKPIDYTGVSQATLDRVSQHPNSTEGKGIAGDTQLEAIPLYNAARAEKVIERGGSSIILGRDRPASRLSGYGGRGDTQAASIDMVVGRHGADARQVDILGERLWADPDFNRDAARVFITQKGDVDEYFGLIPGKVGSPTARSAIALKADSIRLIAREGIKIVTVVGEKNSLGGETRAVYGIDIIAGNFKEELQPLVKGDNLLEALNRMAHHVTKLSGIVDGLTLYLIKVNAALANHMHPTAPGGGLSGPSPTLAPVAIQTNLSLVSRIRQSLINYRINIENYKKNYLHQAGVKYICSRYNHTN